jgi:predicted DNA-binding transcriptional regulator AlpA
MSSQSPLASGALAQKATTPTFVLLTPKEAATRLKVSLSWLAKARMRGDGPPYIRIGRSIRYRETDLLQWMKSRAPVDLRAVVVRTNWKCSQDDASQIPRHRGAAVMMVNRCTSLYTRRNEVKHRLGMVVEVHARSMILTLSQIDVGYTWVHSHPSGARSC